MAIDGHDGGVPDDVRRRYAELIDALGRAGRGDLAEQAAGLAVEQGVWRDPLQRPVDFASDGGHQPVYDPADFWFTRHLEANAEKIRAELDAVTGAGRPGFRPVEEPLLGAGRWDQVVLYEAGRRQDQACALFPVTAGLIEQVPEATTLGPGVVTLSWLEPGTHVVPHCGRTNAQLRVHLGLRVPPDVSIRVGTERLTWQEGKCIVFDDSFEHEVWHRGDRPRVVLLFDVLHPALGAARRERILAGRRSLAEQIAGYLAEHDIRRVESDADGVLFRPGRHTADMVARYLAEAGARRVELHGRSLRIEPE